MLPAQLDIYKASAGSGKTHLLTTQYLRLLFAAPYNFRHILAVTFTNKATAEMKSRILEVLRDIANGNGEAHYVNPILDAFPSKTLAQLQKEAGIIYTAILHDYSRFSVSTIDSFVQKIIRSFAWEMGMDAGFRLQLNANMVKEALADKLFLLLDTDDDLRHWVSDLALARLHDGKSWNFREEMIDLAGEIFKENFQSFEQALAEIEDIPAAFKSLQQKVYACIKAFEKDWKEAGQKAMDIISGAGLYVDDFPYKSGGFAGFLKTASEGVIRPLTSRANGVLNDPSTMEGKKFNADIDRVRMPLHQCLQELDELIKNRSKEYYTAKAIAANLGILRLMKVFSDQLGNYRSENNMLLISDTHLFLRQLTKETESSFIFEKTGSRYQHYLIDEFQDTSGFQWDNFRPLVSNTLSEGNYSLLVGDIKQAIYRWRSGNWELLHRKVSEQLVAHRLDIKSLQDNRRSAKPIIEFNNYLYAIAPALLQQTFNVAANEAPPEVVEALNNAGYFNIIQTAYNESRQLLPDNAINDGLVDIRFINEEKKSDDGNEQPDYYDIVLQEVHQKITALLHNGFQPKSIAILTRNNRDAAASVAYLMDAMQQTDSIQYEIISADALLIKNNPAVDIIISAMQCLLNRKGKLALVQLRQAYVNYRSLIVDQSAIYLDKDQDERILPASFVSGLQHLRIMSLPDLVNELIRLFELNEQPENLAYLLAFQDIVNQWVKYGNDGLLSFLQYWEEEGCSSSLPSEENTANAVNIVTIHKSKGLAFDIVMLPFLNWEIKPKSTKSTQLWVNTAHTRFNDIPVVPVKFKKELANTSFAFQQVSDPVTNDMKEQGYFPELLLSMMDNLNLLYVATTRARRRIYGWCPKKEKTESCDSIDKLLYEVACNMHDDHIPPQLTTAECDVYRLVQQNFNANDNKWTHGVDTDQMTIKNEKQAIALNQMVQADWKQNMVLRFKALQTEEEEDKQLPRNLGILLHEAIALLQHPSQVDKTIAYMSQKGLLTETQQLHAKQTLNRIMQQPVMQQWAAGDFTALKEKDILTADKRYKRPDLILYNKQQTVVVDFKFTDSEKLLDKYQQQLSGYVELLKQLNFASVSGILMFVKDETIQTVDVL